MPYSTQIDDISGTLSDNDVSTEVLGMKFLPNSVIPDFGSIEKAALTDTFYLLEVDVDKLEYLTRAYCGEAFNLQSGATAKIIDNTDFYRYHYGTDRWYKVKDDAGANLVLQRALRWMSLDLALYYLESTTYNTEGVRINWGETGYKLTEGDVLGIEWIWSVQEVVTTNDVDNYYTEQEETLYTHEYTDGETFKSSDSSPTWYYNTLTKEQVANVITEAQEMLDGYTENNHNKKYRLVYRYVPYINKDGVKYYFNEFSIPDEYYNTTLNTGSYLSVHSLGNPFTNL